jgi:hypothetical protein
MMKAEVSGEEVILNNSEQMIWRKFKKNLDLTHQQQRNGLIMF